jgi:hypothetical protein
MGGTLKKVIIIYVAVCSWAKQRLEMYVVREQRAVRRAMQSPVPHVCRVQACMQLRKCSLRKHGSFEMFCNEKSGKKWVQKRIFTISLFDLNIFLMGMWLLIKNFLHKFDVKFVIKILPVSRGRVYSCSKFVKRERAYVRQLRTENKLLVLLAFPENITIFFLFLLYKRWFKSKWHKETCKSRAESESTIKLRF